MSYISHLLHLQELQIDGQTVGEDDDFNVEGETTTEAPDDEANDAAENAEENAENRQAEDNAPANEDTPDTDDNEDDFTLQDEEETNLDDTEDQQPADEGNDQTQENQEEGPNRAEVEEGNDQDDDFNVDPEGGDDNAVGNNDEGNTDTGATTEKETPEDPTDGIEDDDKRAAEEAIYDSLTDDQKRIRVLQLKIDYKDLYGTIINTMQGINDIPKTVDNLETIKRLTLFLTKAKTILIDYVENNFDSNTYLENYTMYLKYLAVFRTVSKVIEELNNDKK